MSTQEEYIEKVRKYCDSYEETIQAMVSFDSAIRWEKGINGYCKDTHFLPGRRMTKPDRTTVTPDIAIQMNHRYGIVGEVKITANNNRDFGDAASQIEKYDDTLEGWKTTNGKINKHDLSLLVHSLHKVSAGRYFDSKKFSRNFTIIACARISQATETYMIEKYLGSFSDSNIDKKLSDVVGVPLEKVLANFGTAKFCDQEPEYIEYTMNVIWMHIFGTIPKKEPRLVNGKRKEFIVADCNNITKTLKEQYSLSIPEQNQPTFPKKAWVKKSLDAFVEIGLAEQNENNSDQYFINYTSRKKDSLLEVFAEKLHKAKQKKKEPSGKQLEFETLKQRDEPSSSDQEQI